MFDPVAKKPAGTRPGTAWASAPKAVLTIMLHVSVVVPETDRGGRGLSIVPSGMTHLKGSKQPELMGISQNTCFTATMVPVMVLLSGLLKGPRHSGELPERSKVMSVPSTIILTSIFRRPSSTPSESM